MYIRTKDKIYEVEEILDNQYFINSRGSIRVVIYEDEIINKADSIPELCDLMIFNTKDGLTHYIDLHKNTVADVVVHFGGENIESVRYCIETSKGLIYIARMDKEKNLQLL